MREFFRERLDELKLLGVQQMHWLMQECKDQEDFDKKKNVLIEGMILVCNEFSYIPVEDQKRIIKDRMAKDQDYDSLNSRTVYKWLNMYRDHFASVNQAPAEIPRIQHTPEQLARIDEIAKGWLADLKAMPTASFRDIQTEMKKIQKEDKERTEEQRSVREKIRTDSENALLIFEKKLRFTKERGLDKVELNELSHYMIDGILIHARNEDEARELYLEVYA